MLRVGALEALSGPRDQLHIFLDFFLVGAGLPPKIAGSIHPPVTTGHGDEVNFLRPAEHVDNPAWTWKWGGVGDQIRGALGCPSTLKTR